MMLTADARGLYPVAVTPFRGDGALDMDSLDRAVDFWTAAGADGLTLLGVMGEAGKLAAAEAAQVVARVTARTRLPVIAGIAAPGFAAMQAVGEAALAAGAAGLMAAPAAPGVRGEAGLVEHFATLCDLLPGAPLVVQDFPLVTGVPLPVPALLAIASACPQVVMLKHEDWPGLAKISALRAAEAQGARRLSILCGNGGQFLPEELGRGADGAMTGFAYPEALAAILAAQAAGDTGRALDLHEACLPLLRMEAQPGPAGLAVRKWLLWRRGVIADPAQRRPGAALDATAAAEVERLRQRLARRLSDLGVALTAPA